MSFRAKNFHDALWVRTSITTQQQPRDLKQSAETFFRFTHRSQRYDVNRRSSSGSTLPACGLTDTYVGTPPLLELHHLMWGCL